jgi:hypothetical protein
LFHVNPDGIAGPAVLLQVLEVEAIARCGSMAMSYEFSPASTVNPEMVLSARLISETTPVTWSATGGGSGAQEAIRRKVKATWSTADSLPERPLSRNRSRTARADGLPPEVIF